MCSTFIYGFLCSSLRANNHKTSSTFESWMQSLASQLIDVHCCFSTEPGGFRGQFLSLKGVSVGWLVGCGGGCGGVVLSLAGWLVAPVAAVETRRDHTAAQLRPPHNLCNTSSRQHYHYLMLVAKLWLRNRSIHHHHQPQHTLNLSILLDRQIIQATKKFTKTYINSQHNSQN